MSAIIELSFAIFLVIDLNPLFSLLISANLGEGWIGDNPSGNYESGECHSVHFGKWQDFQVPNSTSVNDWGRVRGV